VAWLAAVPDAGDRKQPEFHQEFRLLDGESEWLRLTGQGHQRDDRGVRIVLPANQGNLKHSGYRATFPAHGDFEVTASFEVLNADTPTTGYGVGVSIYAAIDPNAGDAISFARRVLASGHTLFVADRMTPGEKKPIHRLKYAPAKSPAGKLRYQRVGGVLHYLAADGLDAEFTEVMAIDFPTADIRSIQVGCDAGNSESGLDIRLLDFTIRADDLPGLPAPPPPPATAAAPGAPPPAQDRPWLALVGVLAVALPLALLGVWLIARRRRRTGTATAAAPVSAPAADTLLAVSCSSCGKQLKVRARAAGKKVKCPQCGQAVHVTPPDP
jgi:hypothetical protein